MSPEHLPHGSAYTSQSLIEIVVGDEDGVLVPHYLPNEAAKRVEAAWQGMDATQRLYTVMSAFQGVCFPREQHLLDMLDRIETEEYRNLLFIFAHAGEDFYWNVLREHLQVRLMHTGSAQLKEVARNDLRTIFDKDDDISLTPVTSIGSIYTFMDVELRSRVLTPLRVFPKSNAFPFRRLYLFNPSWPFPKEIGKSCLTEDADSVYSLWKETIGACSGEEKLDAAEKLFRRSALSESSPHVHRQDAVLTAVCEKLFRHLYRNDVLTCYMVVNCDGAFRARISLSEDDAWESRRFDNILYDWNKSISTMSEFDFDLRVAIL